MACGRYRGRRGSRRDVGSDVLGVRRPLVWSFSIADFDSSWFSGAASCFVLLPRHAGVSDRAQAGSFGLCAFSRIVRRGGARHEIQREPDCDRVGAGGSRGSGIRVVPLPSLDARRHHSVCFVGWNRLQLLSAVLLLSGILVLQPARHHRHHLRAAQRGGIRRFRLLGNVLRFTQVRCSVAIRFLA